MFFFMWREYQLSYNNGVLVQSYSFRNKRVSIKSEEINTIDIHPKSQTKLVVWVLGLVMEDKRLNIIIGESDVEVIFFLLERATGLRTPIYIDEKYMEIISKAGFDTRTLKVRIMLHERF